LVARMVEKHMLAGFLLLLLLLLLYCCYCCFCC
jgi:hypothetical protein